MTTEVNAAAAAGTASAAEASRAAAPGARPHGSAVHGAGHWWEERVSALAALLLWVWFAVSLLRLPSLDRGIVAEWLSSPLAAVPMLLLVAATFWHIRLGLQVIVDDYVHDEGAKAFWTMLILFAAILGAAFAAFAVLRLALAAAPAA
ncbi:MAG: succinate dehydrogenase / fumarate reductase, rane anchor subunit [Sphingomonadales bacterium]|jgi:succinate dehydrogenase / fumarate reductase membrane anchor subunit|nr:succinate dehydrogenase / fumarate reductase, rane anchor subunit [Sphingomonadales bacterium]